MTTDENFILREINTKEADDDETKTYIFKSMRFEKEMILKVKGEHLQELFKLPNGIGDSILVGFGLKNQQVKIESIINDEDRPEDVIGSLHTGKSYDDSPSLSNDTKALENDPGYTPEVLKHRGRKKKEK